MSSTHATVADRGLARGALDSYMLLWAGTLVVAIAVLPLADALHGLLGLGLAPRRGVDVVFSILERNIRVAALPFLFALAIHARPSRCLRGFGDVVVAASLGGNVLLAGTALGAYGPRLLVLLPHWPFEWAGFALALTAWRGARNNACDALELVLLAIACAAFLAAGALLETYLVPGAR